MDLYGRAMPREHNIRAAREILRMQAIAQPEAMKRTP
jgi:hypothetical protein